MAKSPGKCIFCERTGNLSKEHIFPDWLKEYFPRDAATTHTATHIFWPKRIISRAPVTLRRILPGHSGSKKLRVVCRDCNGGWLSQLESWAKHALPPLMYGQRCNIPEDGQRGLATWAIKTAMVAEKFKPRTVSVAQRDRTSLMINLRPPEGWFVWIAAYKGDEWSDLAISQVRGDLSPTPVRDPDIAPYYIQGTTLGMGHLLIAVASSSLPRIDDIFAGKEPGGALQIWPTHPRSIVWPPAKVLNDAEANDLANLIRRTGRFNHSLDPSAGWTFAP